MKSAWTITTLAVPTLSLLALAAFPWGLLREPIERRLAARIGAPVSIGAAERTDRLSFRPTVALSGIRIGQPRWAGRGALAEARRVTVTFRALPLLIGRVRIDAVAIDGLRLDLVRTAERRANWAGLGGGGLGGGGSGEGGAGLQRLTIRDARLRYRDARRHMALAAQLEADAGGMRMTGRGTHRGLPMSLTARFGPAVAAQGFALETRSPQVRFTAAGRLARPYALDRLTARVEARGEDLALLDELIEAGLPASQDFRMTGEVRRAGPRWHIPRLAGTVGRSRLAARLDVAEADDRVTLSGRIDAAALDFADFASDAQRAAGAAARARTGPRVVPATRIRLDRLGRLDARLRIEARRLLVGQSALFRSLSSEVRLERRRLSVAPLRIGLAHGAATGRLAVDHRAGVPKLAIDLRMRGGRIEDFLRGGTRLRGPLEGRVRLDGRGVDVRAAVARSAGTLALVGRGGDIERRTAALAGGDILDRSDRALRTPLHCLIVRLDARPGMLSIRRMLIDSGVSRVDAQGRIGLPDEALALVLTGRSKTPDLIRATPSVRLAGSVSAPELRFPAVQRERGLIGKIGATLKVLRVGRQPAPVADAYCAALAAATL